MGPKMKRLSVSGFQTMPSLVPDPKMKNIIIYNPQTGVNNKGEIIVLECQLKLLTIHNPQTGVKIKTIEAKDNHGSKVLVDPYYVTVTPQNNIVVTDTAAPNIKVISAEGKFLANYGGYGTKSDQVLQPYGVCCDDYGYTFVADNKNYRIHLLQAFKCPSTEK